MEKHPGGRPTRYTAKVVPVVKKMAEKGATDWEIARELGIDRATLYRWRGKYKQFSDALKMGKDEPDARVERSLYERATGYTFESEKVFQFQGEIVRAKTLEHVPPDTAAAFIWLKNRRKETWRDRHEVDNTGEVTHKWEEMNDEQLDAAIQARQDRLSGTAG